MFTTSIDGCVLDTFSSAFFNITGMGVKPGGGLFLHLGGFVVQIQWLWRFFNIWAQFWDHHIF